MRWYQVTGDELTAISLAQLVSAGFASAGTFALGSWLDLQKDMAFAIANDQAVPEFLQSVTSFAFWSWLMAWGLALTAIAWQFIKIEGVKHQHGDPPPWKRVVAWFER